VAIKGQKAVVIALMVWTPNHEILPSAKGQRFNSCWSVKIEVFKALVGGGEVITRRRKRSYEKPVSIQEGAIPSKQERNPGQCKVKLVFACQFKARKTQQRRPKII